MENVIQYLQANWLEIFSFITGVLFLIYEVRQKNMMWIICIVASSVCAVVFYRESLYASMCLNIYYVGTAVWGIFAWMRDARRLKDEGSEKDKIHLRPLSLKAVIISLVAFVVLSVGLMFLLKEIGDESSVLDAMVFVLSIIATIWLVKTYLQQWLVWIVADILSTLMCFSQEMYWMALLYTFYSISAIYGFWHWKRRGVYLNN
ncbi:MAG: nicotinamide mononucleotide transporter [Bacteroidales bacterium]|nr:nicotinamide mononucleotide transporter [Bacteroidales bacterium]